MTQTAMAGHNNPPTPIETCIAQYDGVICEAQNWADGDPVTDEAGMNAIDKVIKQFKTYRSDLGKAATEQTEPFHKAWKAEVAAVKVYTDDADMLQSSLIACVAPFKAKLAADKAEAERMAREAAWEATRKAEEAAKAVNTADIEAQREVAAAVADAKEKQRAANAAAKNTVKGLRTVTRHEVIDHRALLHWIAVNRKDDLTAFIEEWARKNHKDHQSADGLRVWTIKEVF